MNFEQIKTEIQSFRSIQSSPYGDFTSSQVSIEYALKIVDRIYNQFSKLPITVSPADGVSLTYSGKVSVEIDDDGEMLIFYPNDGEETFSQIDDCVNYLSGVLAQ